MAEELGPFAGEDLCYLSGDWRILQLVDGHRWSLDDLMTAWAARRACPTPPHAFLDLGCGIGSVLLMMAWCFPEANGLGIEAQAISVDLARRSLVWNGVDRRCQIVHADFRLPEVLPVSASFDLITGTPPYFPIGSALESARPQWAACHSEHRGGVEAYCLAAAPRLAANGLLVLCAPAGAMARVEAGARASGLHIREQVDVIPRQGKPALLSVFVLGNAPGESLPQALPGNSGHLPPMDRHAGESRHPGWVAGLDPGFRRDDGGVEPNLRAETPQQQTLVVRDASGRRSKEFLQIRKEMGLPP